MKNTATAFALCLLTLLFNHSSASAQAQKPSAEYTAIWDVTQNRWKDTIPTFTMSYTPEYTLTSRSGNFLTTYSGFTPATGDVYQSRFFWEPRMSYAQVRIDSVHVDGKLTPIRLDQYDRSIAGRTAFTRSTWTSTEWKPTLTSVSMTDTLGLLRSSVNHALVAGILTLTDSTHVDVTQDMKGNVTKVRLLQWTMQDPTLQLISEQRFTLAGDGSISVAEIWNTDNGDLAPSLRVHSIDWVARNKTYPYVQREQSSRLFYGGEGFLSATVDLASGGEWTEIYQLHQTFDSEDRLTSYIYDGFTRDTFTFDEGLITLNQHDDFNGLNWMTSKGSKTIYDRDANGSLRSVITQKYDPMTSSYVNDRLYFYAYGTADVKTTARGSTLSAYPNPATETLTISSDKPVISSVIISATGAVLLKSSGNTIDVRGLAPGAYGVKITTASGEEALKFVKVQ